MPFTYAIADLHGRYDLLSEAVTKIVEHSRSDRPATIITLGDYVDRGPKSRQVIERLAADITSQPGNSTAHMRSIARMARKAFGTGHAERAVAPTELVEQLVELSLPRGTGIGEATHAEAFRSVCARQKAALARFSRE